MAKKMKVQNKNDVGGVENVEDVFAIINKKYGDGSLQYGDTSVVIPCSAISTGAPSLDMAIGVGGVPRGRIVELYGPESSGKTTLALSIVAEAQRGGGKAAFIDAEHALDKYWARNIGINVAELAVSQPDSGEQALEICELLVRSGKFDVIVVDSVAALTPQCEIDGEMGDANIGAQARLMSKAMRKLKGLAYKTDTCIVFINQIRNKIGVMFGSPETTPGGKALKFYATVRLEIRKTTVIKSGNVPIGQEVKTKVTKNKVAPPFEEALFKIYFGKPDQKPAPIFGIDGVGSLLSMAALVDVVAQTGSWYVYKDLRLGQGAENAAAFLRGNIEVYGKIKQDVYDAIKLKQAAPNWHVVDSTTQDVEEGNGFDDDEEDMELESEEDDGNE